MHFRQVRLHLILLDEAAKADDVCYPWNHLEVAYHYPVLQRSEIGRTDPISLHTKAVDFTNRGRQTHA